MQISPTETVKRFRVARATLYKHMKDGTVTYEIDATGNKGLNIAELERVYERRAPKNDSEQVNISDGSVHQTDMNVQSRSNDKEVELLREILEGKDAEIERWQEAHREAQMAVTRITALIEDKREGAETRDADGKIEKLTDMVEKQLEERKEQDSRIKELEEKIGRYGKKGQRLLQTLEEERERRQRAEKEVKEEKSKGIFQKLFGS